MSELQAGDLVEIPAMRGRVLLINEDGDVWVTLEGTSQNWVFRPERLRKLDDSEAEQQT